MNLPSIHVMRNINVPGLAEPKDSRPQAGDFGKGKKGQLIFEPMAYGPLDEVFGDTAPEQAMFVQYHRRDGGPLSRCNTTCQGIIDLVSDYAAFDADLNAQFDVKGKLSWSKLGEARTAEMEARLERLKEILTKNDAPVVRWYRSKNGLRFVHLLHSEVTVAGLEALLQRLAAYYAEAGIKVDESCFDWTRCFKVPRYTLEDGSSTGDAEWFREGGDDGAVTIVNAEELALQPTPKATGQVFVAERQEAGHARESVEMDGRLTPDGRAASAHIAPDPMLHGICFGSTPIVGPEANWHLQLTKIIGKLTKRCVGQPWATEQFLYGLVALKVAELPPDEKHNWLDEVWGMVCDYLAADEAELAAKNAEVKTIIEEKAADAQPEPAESQRFFAGVRSWYPGLEGLDDEGVKARINKDRLGILAPADGKGGFRVLGPDGFYDESRVSEAMLPMTIEALHMQWLIELTYVGRKTKTSKEDTIIDKAPPMLLKEYGRVFMREDVRFDRDGNYLRFDRHGRPIFALVPFALRRDIPGVNHAHIRRWLTSFWGTRFRDGMNALSMLLLFQYGPTAALVNYGPTGTGKSLLIDALAFAISTGKLVNGLVLTDNFNIELLDSPIVAIREGVDPSNKGKSGEDAFRKLITGEDQRLEKKGVDAYSFKSPHRLIAGVNDFGKLRLLFGRGGSLSSAAWAAIAVRTAAFQVQPGAVEVLNEHKADLGRWVGSDDAPGDIVQFIFWWIENELRWIDEESKQPARAFAEGAVPVRIINPANGGLDRGLLFDGNVNADEFARLREDARGLGEVKAALQDPVSGREVEGGFVYFVPGDFISWVVKNHHGLRREDVEIALDSLVSQTEQAKDNRYSFKRGRMRAKRVRQDLL